MKLEDRLRDAPIPGVDEARARARRVVLAATPPPAPRRVPTRLVTAVAAALALGGALLTPPGEAVGGWVKRLVRTETSTPPKPALTRLPAAGRLLVTGPGGTWVVDRDGSRRRLGPYDDATWSPHGLFVAVTRDRQLLAVKPPGEVRWAIARPDRVEAPRWSSEGFRIAYRTNGTMRIVAGDGAGDRLLTTRVAAVPAAWRPGPRHEVTLVRQDGALETWNADAGRRLWRRSPGPLPLAMQWREQRLVVVQPDRTLLLDARGRTVRATALRESAHVAAISADGRRVAVAGPSGVRALGTTVAVRADSLTFAPDGRHLLIASGDQWRFLPGDTAVADIARQFDPRRTVARGMPTVAGWAP